MERYVCVRLVKLWGVDLQRFQFDTNLTWAALLLSSHGQVLGRYGGLAANQEHKGTAQVNVNAVSLAGFEKFLEAGLTLTKKLDQGDPLTLQGILGKQPRKEYWSFPREMPAIAESFNPGEVSLSSCLHCHNVGSGRIKSLWLERRPVPESQLFPYPEPELLGFSMDGDFAARVQAVEPNSPADHCGLRPGDDLFLFAGQQPISPADIRWVLHHAQDDISLPLTVLRAGQPVALSLALPTGYRRHRSLMTASLLDLLPGFGIKTWLTDPSEGVFVVDIPAWWGEHDGYHLTGKRPWDIRQSGLRDGDTVLAVDGRKDWLSQADFIAWFWQTRKPSSILRLRLRREAREFDLNVQLP